MDARGEAGVVGQTLQQPDELAPLRRLERSQDLLVVRVGDGRSLVQKPPRRRGQMDGMGAPVAGMAAPLDEPAHLEIVEKADHRVPVDRHQVRKLLLRLAVRRGEVGEQTKVPGLQAKRGKAVGEHLGRVKSHLGEQEPWTLGKRLRHGINYPGQ